MQIFTWYPGYGLCHQVYSILADSIATLQVCQKSSWIKFYFHYSQCVLKIHRKTGKYKNQKIKLTDTSSNICT